MLTRSSGQDIGRRTFLKGAGLASAGFLAVNGVPSGATWGGEHARTEGAGSTRRSGAAAFDHVVVLMLENRSYDHLFGWLYRDDQLRPGQRVAGLYQHPSSNAAPDGTLVAAYPYSGTRNEQLIQPMTNTGEDLRHVDRQLFGGDSPSRHPKMNGFVADYVDNYRAIHGHEPSRAAFRQVMGGFAPETLPVLSTLARSFGVFDHWFGAVPSDTFCNRSFVHAGTSHGFVTNAGHGGYAKWLNAPPVPTLFNRLQDGGHRWRVYYDETQTVSLTGILSAPSIEPFWQTNFRNMAQFHSDARTGRLPAYSFIEPRMIFNRNSLHPPTSSAPIDAETATAYDKGVADMLAGEALVAEVYESIRQSVSRNGSNSTNTTLIITFDESGGLFDHVAPPSASPPGDTSGPGELGFNFDRLGCRVPAIVVSAWTEPGTVINDQVDHTSIIATVSAQQNLAPLTDRDAAAQTLSAAVNRTSPRMVTSWPSISIPRVPQPPLSRRAKVSHPQTPTGLGILGLVLARFEPTERLPSSVSTAFDTLADRGTGLFGIRDLQDR